MAVVQRGTDSSGRPIRSSAACWAAFDAACNELGFAPVVVQGGYMGSGGAAASAATHAGDAFDLRLRDRTADQRTAMIRAFRNQGFAYWERYPEQGFDLHAHMVPGPWASPAPQALAQFNDYINGRNGLARHGEDYHWRPSPLVTTPPPEDDMNPAQETLLKDTAAAVKRLEKGQQEQADSLLAFRRAMNVRDKASQVREIEAIRQGIAAKKSNDQIADEVAKLREGK